MGTYVKQYKEEIDLFKEIGESFLRGEMKVPEFKGKSGGMGVYAQRGGKEFMIRLRMPSGYVSRTHLKRVLDYAKQYKLTGVHLTTRQTIQLHDLSLDAICEIMKDAMDYGLFTRGGGGNFPRNVSLSPMSGVEQGEAFDVTPYAMQVGEVFIKQAAGYLLPRKLKVAFSNTEEDTSCATVNDLGFVAVVVEGKPYFRVYLAGGLGKNPEKAIEYPKLIQPSDAMYYVEAMLRTYIELGDYQNKATARTRYIPKKIGEEAFFEAFDKHVERVKKILDFEKLDPELSIEEAWEFAPNTNNRKAQKQKGLYTVILHPKFGILSVETLEQLVSYLDKISGKNKTDEISAEAIIPKDFGQNHDPQVRLSMEEEMYIRNLTLEQANDILEIVAGENLETNLSMSFSCVGVPTCQIGILESRELLKSILKAVRNQGLDENLFPRIHISGCPNSCARHQIAPLGFVGKKQFMNGQVTDVYEVYLGGELGVSRTKLGDRIAAIKKEDVPVAMVELGNLLLEKEQCFEKYAKEQTKDVISLFQRYDVSDAK